MPGEEAGSSLSVLCRADEQTETERNWARRLTPSARETEEQIKRTIARRGFFKLIGLGTLGLGFGVSIFDSVYQYAESANVSEEQRKHLLLAVGTVDFMGFHAKEITPNDAFYITTYSKNVPEIAYDAYSLRVEGLVGKPYTLTMQELEELHDITDYVTLQCIGNPVGGDAIGNALWEGVTLRKLLDAASPKKGIVKAGFFAEDGYSDSIPYALARSGDVFLAYKMNGQPLPRQHGYPLRAIVPGVYGMKHVKWISKIELVNYNFKGFWEKRGWSDEAIMSIRSEILLPMNRQTVPLGNYVIGGIAFAGRYGISRVQVSLNRGKSWTEASVKAPLSRWAWSLWEYDWKPARAGRYTIRVRGIDRSGKIQESASLLARLQGSFPDGATGIHSVDVTVE